jgi:Flp pilus assembly protein CpaB
MKPGTGQAARDGPGTVRKVLRDLRRALSWHRRLVAAGLAAAAVAAGLAAVQPPRAETATVVTANRDLAAGSRVTASDVRQTQIARAAVPSGALTDLSTVTGRTTAGPVRRGELLTDVRLLGASMLDGYGADVVASPVRIADPAAAELLHVGDMVDVLAAPVAERSTGSARVIAGAVRVISVPHPAAGGLGALDSTPSGEGALLVLATTPEVAADLASAAVSARLSITLRPG